jgi:hypothetical protein
MKVIIKLKNDSNAYQINSLENYLMLDNIHKSFNYDNITILHFTHDLINSNLINIPELPKYLEILSCSNNGLVSLPELPNSLECLECSDN